MTTNDSALPAAIGTPASTRPALGGLLATAASATLRTVARLAKGRSRGPRAYRAEGFPEHELYQVMAGKRDRFHGL
jgi:hypothetical protein